MPSSQHTFVGCIPITSEELKKQMEKICRDIEARDPTFHYRIHPSYINDYPYILAIYDQNKNQLWRRLVWLKNKTPLKQHETPMWIKQKRRL